VKAFIPWLGALLVAGTATATAQADPYYWRGPAQVPNAFRPGPYGINQCGMTYGSSYSLPPCGPFNGFQPTLPCNGFQSSSPCNTGGSRYFRSPRDFFMLDDP
jgi:hypothetical protein